jgi:hypothetical protein
VALAKNPKSVGFYRTTIVAGAHKELEPQAVYFAEGDIADCDFDVWILRALHKQRNFDENILKGL